jgi:hypothetical protein
VYLNRQTINTKGVVCKGVLIVVRLKSFKVGMLLKTDKANLSTLQLYNFQTIKNEIRN